MGKAVVSFNQVSKPNNDIRQEPMSKKYALIGKNTGPQR